MGTVGEISIMQDITRIMQVRQSALRELDDNLINDELVNDELKEDHISGESYA